jgi:hypothetical protein
MAGVIIGLAFFLAHELLPCASAIDRTQFPPNFLFGTSTSAYQVRLTHLPISSKQEEHSWSEVLTTEEGIASVSVLLVCT